MTEVAQYVMLSLSACYRRFRNLKTAGVIRGFCAELDLLRSTLIMKNIVSGRTPI